MANECIQFNTKLKPYHIILLSCLLSPLLILNSNYINNKRAKEELNKEKSKLFDQMLSSRHLQENEKSTRKSDKVCQKGSKDLVNYYQTGQIGNLKKIGLDDLPIKSEEKGKAYFDALINIFKALKRGKEDNSNNNLSGDTRRNLIEIGNVKDDIIAYVKHLIPFAYF